MDCEIAVEYASLPEEQVACWQAAIRLLWSLTGEQRVEERSQEQDAPSVPE